MAGRAGVERLFAYGTLRPGLAPPGVRAHAARLRPLGPARVRGWLYDGGVYPAAIPDPRAPGLVVGELLALPEPAVEMLAWLDRYEGAEPGAPAERLFRRERARAELPGGAAASCWIYVWNRPVAGLVAIADGDWAAHR